MSFEPPVFEGHAPGKAILFGEHAVVHGRPAIAVPVTQVGTTVRVRPGVGGERRFISPATGLDVDLAAAEDGRRQPGFWGAALVDALAQETGRFPAPFVLEIDSTIPVAAGLGSGAALAVAAARALAAFGGGEAGDEAINRIAFEVEKTHHGTPSGIDNTTVTYARPVCFRRGFPPDVLSPAAPLPLVIGLTGIASPTGAVVADVRRLSAAEPERFNRIFNAIGAIVEQARAAIEAGDLPEIGRLMDCNHEWLCEMSVSSPELDRLTAAARAAGALGAKLSGGGRGGNMLALVPPGTERAVEQALSAAGAVRTIRTTVSPV